LLSIGLLSSQPAPAGANIFQLGLVDIDAPGFQDGDGDAVDALITFLGTSDGAAGNNGFIIDTVSAPTGSTVWIGTGAEHGLGSVNLRSNIGVFLSAVCSDNNGDGDDFDLRRDECKATGYNSSRVTIPEAGN